jgi:peroxiredoxin
MVELGELEKRHRDFESRGVRIVAISNDDRPTAEATQRDFPHLSIVSDPDQDIAKAMQVIHPHMGPGATDTNAPTTFLVDGSGRVLWFFRPERFIARLGPDELLAAIDGHRPGN